LPDPAPRRGADTDAVLAGHGFNETEVQALRDSGVIG
jgi:crotonobetainyl-CoA:carnitine CoA-transferase CaiB-like acyl-CoA transferase